MFCVPGFAAQRLVKGAVVASALANRLRSVIGGC